MRESWLSSVGVRPRDAALIVGAAAALGLMVIYLWPWTSDDAFISFRYSVNLAHGQGLVFNSGERVEGYSNFLFVLLLSAASLLSLDVVVVAKLLGVASLVVVVWLVYRWSIQWSGERNAGGVALLFCGTAAYLAYWAVSGLETVVYAMLVLVAAVQYVRYLRDGVSALTVAPPFLAVALMRAEGVVFFVMTCGFHLGLLVSRQRRWSLRWGEVVAVSAVLLPYLAVLAFRLSYFGSLVPNTVVAKTGYARQLSDGIIYLVEFLPIAATLVYLGLRPRWLPGPPRRPGEWYLWWLCGWWMVMVVGFGGDWMLLYRFFVPILPLLILLASVGFGRMWVNASHQMDRGRGSKRVLLAVLGCGLLLNFGLSFWQIRPAVMENYMSWEQATRDVGLWLAANAREGQSIALFDAGKVPYYSGLRTIDCAGLVDPTIAELPGRFERKQGVAAYVMDLRPEYVELNANGSIQDNRFVPAEPLDFFQEPDFLTGYRLVFYRDAWRTSPGHHFILLYQRDL